MSYQVLARKFRPQSFDDLIGQSHVATTLTNALKSGKIAHAYLFSGPRGVGKTTTARVLAKALNCEKGPTPTPCNVCDACKRIAQGQEMVDVLEIDAASNRGIEEIRELRDNVRYAPAKSRYKVYIIDEAHQITHDAFNAFLKTLEEPPAHAVFILATTEHQKIPATILSRCQMFRFKKVSAEEIVKRLVKITETDHLNVDPAALERLAKAAGGSVRDALSLLDQALSFSTGSLTALQVEQLLGFLPEEFLVGFASALLERKPSGVLQWTKQLSEEGWDFPQFVRDFREFLRQTLVSQADDSGKALTVAGRSVSLPELLFMIKVMGQCLDDMRWNDNPQLVLELYALRLTQPFVDAGELLRKIEQLEGALPIVAPAGRKPSDSSPPQVVSGGPVSLNKDAGSPLTTRGDDGQKSAPKADFSALWKKLLSELWKKPSVASHMERAFLKSADTGEWVVAFPDAFSMAAVQRSQAYVMETLQALAGRAVALRFIHEARETRENSPMEIVAAPVGDEKMAAVSQDANVRKVLDVFKGRVRTPDAE